mmetsp:Transcript_66360/g.184874  ORF Transcript_66360/g.184874 Transcript_66360/m.184874 type:complete len:421 (+) Transcript_66360:90-1352(+)
MLSEPASPDGSAISLAMCESLIEVVKANHDSLVQNIRQWFDEQLEQKRRLAPPAQTGATDQQCDVVQSQVTEAEDEPQTEALRKLVGEHTETEKAPESKLREVIADSLDTADGVVPTTGKNASMKVAITCDDGTVNIIDMESGDIDWASQRDNRPWTVRWSPNGEALAVGMGDGRLDIIDAESKQTVRMVQHEGPVWSVQWHPNGSRIATGCGDAMLRIISAKTGQVERVIQGDGPIFAVAWNHSGTRIASGSYSKFYVYCHPSGQESYSFPQQDLLVAAEWHPHCSTVATAAANIVRILDGETGHVQHDVVFPDKLWTISWHPSGLRLAAGGVDWKIHIINTESGLVEQKFTHRGVGVVRCISWHCDGSKIAVASDAQKVFLLDEQSGEMVQKQEFGDTIWAITWKPSAVQRGISKVTD